ncbi:MAG TPA: GNAT family N-acetyltransferase [Pseudoxanthomonas sp.]|nr:GNAT family N-acetyltransferase [Pseudoxanthomonas sp.]
MPRPEYEIRSAIPTDAAELARLSAELGYPASEGEVASRLGMLLAQATQHVFVAAHRDGLLGWVGVERRNSLENGEKIEIVGFVVDASTRRLGVGQALLRSAERWALAQGFEALMVRSNAMRTESHPFYEKHGYARHKTQHVYARTLK